MDEARQADTADEPIDEYLLQIWPRPDEEPAVLGLSSATARSVVDRSAQA